jgi:hypothetical protein
MRPVVRVQWRGVVLLWKFNIINPLAAACAYCHHQICISPRNVNRYRLSNSSIVENFSIIRHLAGFHLFTLSAPSSSDLQSSFLVIFDFIQWKSSTSPHHPHTKGRRCPDSHHLKYPLDFPSPLIVDKPTCPT